MTSLDLATGTMRTTARPAFPARMLASVVSVLRAWRNRRAFYRLGEMSDAELSDIGLTRADLHVAMTAPLAQDPTSRLRAIAEARAGLAPVAR